MKTNIIIYTLLTVIFGVWLYSLYLYFDNIDFGLVLLAIIGTISTFLIIGALIGVIWRVQNGVELLATLETNPETLKLKLYLKMLPCRIDRFPNVLNEITDEAQNYPQWDILGSKMFKSWYKENVDFMLKYPMNYDLSWLSGGQPYIKEKDPYYDINAQPWDETDWTEIPLI